MAVTDSFTYDRTARLIERTIKKNADVLKQLVQKPYSTDTICEVRWYISELNSDYDRLKHCLERGLDSVDQGAAAAEIRKEEDAIFNHFEGVKKLVSTTIAKGNSYISDFEGQRTRESLNNSTLNSTIHPATELNVKLPRIDLPKFDGKIEDFLEFSALFQNVIHEESTITKVKKLYYLKAALTGPAHALVRDTPFTDRGYDEA